MSDNFFIWQYQSVPYACVLKAFIGIDKKFRLYEGVPLEAGFPAGVQFKMHPDFPNDLLLIDNCQNASMCVVTSKRVQTFLRSQELQKVEYLPVSIVDHKGQVASKDYCIVHALDPVDCIDRNKSVFQASAIEPTRIGDFKKMVLDESAIPPDRAIFRLKGFWDVVIVRRRLAEAIDSEKFTGISWRAIRDYPHPGAGG